MCKHCNPQFAKSASRNNTQQLWLHAPELGLRIKADQRHVDTKHEQWLMHRSCQYISGSKGSQTRKCAHCREGRHVCYLVTDPQVVKLVNQAVRARRAREPDLEGERDDDEQQQLEAVVEEAEKSLRAGLR